MPDRLSDLIITRVAFVPKGDNPAADVVLWKGNPDSSEVSTPAVIGGRSRVKKCPFCGSTYAKAAVNSKTELCAHQAYEVLIKRTFTAQQRRDLEAKGQAMKGGAYPIENAGDIKAAVSSIGRGGASSAAIKAHIIKVARKLGLTSALPKTWGVTKTSWMDAPRRDRLGAAVAALVATDGPGRKEDVVADDTGKESFTLPDDTPEEVKKHVEELEAERSTLEEKVTELEAAAKVEETVDSNADPIEAALAKSDLDAGTRAALEAAKLAKADSETAKAEVEKLRAEGDLRDAVEKARVWKHLTAKPEDFGPMLASLRKHDAAMADEVERVMTSADNIAGEALREIGKDGGEVGGDAMEKLKAMAAELAKTDHISEAIAFTKVVETEEGKKLHEEYAKEVREG